MGVHKKNMIKCSKTDPEQYVWPNRCMEGWEEYEFGEYENEETCQAGESYFSNFKFHAIPLQ